MQEVRDKVDSPQEIGTGPWWMALHPGVCAMGPCSGKVDWGGEDSIGLQSVPVKFELHPGRE